MGAQGQYLAAFCAHGAVAGQHRQLGRPSPAWAATLAQLPGYSAEGAQSGQVLSMRALLPWWQYRQAKTGRVKTGQSEQDLKPQKISSRSGL